MVPVLVTLGSDSGFWFQLTQGQFGDYVIAQEQTGEKKRLSEQQRQWSVWMRNSCKKQMVSLSFLLLLLIFLFCFFLPLNSVEQTTQQHIFHLQSFTEGNSPLLFRFFLMFTDRKANNLWRIGRADLSRSQQRTRPAPLVHDSLSPVVGSQGKHTYICLWMLSTKHSTTVRCC